MDLDGQTSIDWVLPAHGQDLDLALVNFGKVGKWDFEAFREHAQTGGTRLCAAHPDVRVWSVLDLGSSHKLLLLLGEDVVHSVARDESSSAKWDVKFIACAIIVTADLAAASRDLDSEESRDYRWLLVI